METKVMKVAIKCRVKDAAEGAWLGPNAYIWPGTTVVIEISNESPHDGFVHVVGPNPPINPDGTYLKYKKQAWVELAHLEEANAQTDSIVINIDWDNHTWTVN